MMAFMTWAQMIVTFQGGAADLVASAHWVFKLHIFLGLTVFLVFPFSRLVHIWSAPFGYLTRNYQVVRSRKTGGAR
ncbi:respiratory nitrate reductase subunit gamma [Fodinicurvata halophila]